MDITHRLFHTFASRVYLARLTTQADTLAGTRHHAFNSPTYTNTLTLMQTKNDTVLQGFAPVLDQATHTLILGSFPGVASLRLQQYYAFQHNQFWRLLSGVLKQDVTALAYPDRLQVLLAHGIGLWDVFDVCQRQGSLDSAIRQGELNDFASLQKSHPNIQKLCFNGKTAGKMQAHFTQLGYQTLLLPSSSPAYAQMRIEEKMLKWQLIGEIMSENNLAK